MHLISSSSFNIQILSKSSTNTDQNCGTPHYCIHIGWKLSQPWAQVWNTQHVNHILSINVCYYHTYWTWNAISFLTHDIMFSVATTPPEHHIHVLLYAQIHTGTHLLRTEQEGFWSQWTGRGKDGHIVGRAKGCLTSTNFKWITCNTDSHWIYMYKPQSHRCEWTCMHVCF
jgi:hypothetical protein